MEAGREFQFLEVIGTNVLANVALSEAVSELKFINELLKTFNINLIKPIDVYEDNSGAVNIAKHGNLTKNSKHIEVHYHYVQ